MRLRGFAILIILVLASVALVPALSEASPLARVGRRQGCEVAEERMQVFIYRGLKVKRFEKNLPYRVALAPVSITMGFLMNYFGQSTYVLPLIAPTGYNLQGNEFSALMLENVFTFQHIKGSRLDDVDDSVVAAANFDVGMCYYEDGYWAQAAAYFDMLSETRYSKYIGRDNLYFLLGDCYYRLNMLDRSVENYRRFLLYCDRRDDRISFVERRIKTIDAVNKKGLWGFERDE